MEAFVGILIDILNSMIEKEHGLLCGVATNMQKLSSLLSTIKAVLEDAEQKRFTNRAIQLWFQKLNGVAYETDDVLDDYAAQASRVKYKNSGRLSLMCYPVAGNLVFRHRMKEILAKFNEIADERMNLGLSDQERGSYFNASHETGSVVNELEVLGRNDEKKQIVRILTEDKIGDDQNVSVLPIVGVGGLGKTTLAQLVFNDKRVIEHFEPKLWVWVSEDFDGKRIIKALIESVEKTSIGDYPLDGLQRKLQELLRGKRYLIVLDDVWNENPREWEKLKSVLECGSSGSSIVMTTRKQKVAEIMRTLETRYLSSLSDDQCWSLFRQQAFDCQEKQERLEAVGKEIVEKCGGIPLAAKALGGFLRFKSEAEWNSVKCNELWNLPQDTTDILPVEGNLVFRHRIGTRMKEILAKFNEIADERIKLGLSDQKRGSYFNASRETDSWLNEPDLVLGRDEAKDKIVDILMKEKDRVDQNVSVLPIVGVGGLGKTTLAQLVFNDKRVIEHFEPKLWVWVSEDFDGKRIIKALIESVEKTSAGDLALNILQGKLQELLRGKRYLIVLDDVWNENPQEWEKLKSVLECGSKGSSIVTTTRMEKVATIMGTLQTYYLSSLSENQSWSLFRQRAFGRQEAEEYPNLVVIGKEIVKKCGGVPLAAKALGGFLQCKREENEWNYVKCSEIWNLPEDETHIFPALRLSYLNLPVELRGCFAHCAVFPKGSVIEKEEVIRLWMANGLISSNGTMEVEDVGDAVLTELHYKSLFQAVEKDEFGNALTFKMHDLVHELARSVMEAKHGGTESNRAMMLDITGTDQFSSFLSKCGSLRALIVRSAQSKEVLTKLPPAVSKLKHLRHLDLSGSDIDELPNSICDLWNLQILNLNDCEYLQCLPKGMRFLRNLQHLCLQGCGNLTDMPSGIEKLTCLRTLSMVVLGGQKGFQLSELRDLNELKGELIIRHLERVEDKKDAEAACLIRKQSLRRLYLYFNGSMLQWYKDEEVLEALKPCPYLQSLHIEGFNGSSFPSWFSTVTTVRVYNSATDYIVESTATAAAMSPSLKTLVLWDMPNLQGMLKGDVQDTPEVFPQLQSLYFLDCPTLMLPLPLMPSLKELDINMCPNMAWDSISTLTSLNSLEVGNIEGLSRFPEAMLQKLSLLESLKIKQMKNLQALPRSLASLTALKELTIEECPKLESLPEEGLRGLAFLQELHLFDCFNLVSLSMGTKALESLTHLRIFGSNATALPEEVKHLAALQELELECFSNLTSLPDWFGDHLTSLRRLTLWSCPKLKTLPSSIQMMTTLQSLTIRHCDLLGPRCERGGEEWHIPDLKIE